MARGDCGAGWLPLAAFCHLASVRGERSSGEPRRLALHLAGHGLLYPAGAGGGGEQRASHGLKPRSRTLAHALLDLHLCKVRDCESLPFTVALHCKWLPNE